MKIIKPKKLNVGDSVAIVSLSSGILGESFVKHQIVLGIKRLNEMGLKTVFMPNALKGIDFVKNNPKQRAEDLKLAFQDSKIKAIICAIGGEDTYKTIPYLMEDEEFKKLVITSPKIFLGFSDSTNNHIMLNKLGLTTYYGLNFLSDLCELQTNMLPYTKKSYLTLFENKENLEVTPSSIWYENRESYSRDNLNTDLKYHTETKGFEFLFGKDKVNGILWGGCLDSIYDIYSSNRFDNQRHIYEKYNLIPNEAFFKNKILFLETSEEKPEPKKFEEMMELLAKEKVLQNIKGLLVGKPFDEVYYNEYKNILIKFALKFNLPTVYNLNFGHSLPRTIMPYGIKAQIDFDNKKIRMLESLFN